MKTNFSDTPVSFFTCHTMNITRAQARTRGIVVGWKWLFTRRPGELFENGYSPVEIYESVGDSPINSYQSVAVHTHCISDIGPRLMFFMGSQHRVSSEALPVTVSLFLACQRYTHECANQIDHVCVPTIQLKGAGSEKKILIIFF